MPALAGPSPGMGARVSVTSEVTVSRMLVTVYARERLEDAIRAVAEDAIGHDGPEGLPWHADTGFDDQLGIAIREIAAAANLQLIERLELLLETAPPSVRGRMSSVPRWPEQA